MEEKVKRNDYQPIGNYGIIGNLHTVALVSITGSIDFLSFTRFDSPTLFASVLDKQKGGYFQICPLLAEVDYKQLYLPDSNILLSRFLSDDGMAEVTDFMPIKKEESNCTLIRSVKTVLGKLPFKIVCKPAFDYAREEHEVEAGEKEVIFRTKSKIQPDIRLSASIPLTIKNNEVFAEFSLCEREQADFVMEAIPPEGLDDISIREFVDENFHATVEFWNDWIHHSTYKGRWREMVNRSALTLKLLTSNKFGSVVAAATFGLPEMIGGGRNWDYRYTWIRDASFTMYAFLRLGFLTEARDFINWIKRRMEQLGEAASLQLMYAVDGNSDLEEKELDQMEGYKGSKPVRIGNAAYKQLQIDIYGELIDAIYLYNKHGGPITYDFWHLIEKHVDYVCKNWRKPDHGIWEVRDEKREFLHTRIMCWVAIDRAVSLAQSRSFPSPLDEWRKIRDEIFKDVYYNFWNEEKQAFVQSKGSNVLDAAALLMPLVRFISPVEPRWLATLEAIEKELVTDSLVYRYKHSEGASDGLHGKEGTFSMCSFWFMECLSKSGQVAKARLYFEKMTGYGNHLGLFSEQLGLRGQHLGNFPQAFTHLGLISAALELNQDLNKKEFEKS